MPPGRSSELKNSVEGQDSSTADEGETKEIGMLIFNTTLSAPTMLITSRIRPRQNAVLIQIP